MKMKRTPLPKRTTPLPRSTKPLKRTPIIFTLTKRKKVINAKMTFAKTFYFNEHGLGDGTAPCQVCLDFFKITQANAHHKIKRSLWATASAEQKTSVGEDLHGMGNLVIVCRKCHGWIHEKSERLDSIRDHEGNADNGIKINDLHHLYTEVKEPI